MKCENILFDLAICSGGHFANINDFCKTVVKTYNLHSYSDIFTLLSNDLSASSHIISNSQALKTLINDDLSRFSIDSYDLFEGEEYEFLYEHANKVISFYQSIGLDISVGDVNICLCDIFPQPFHQNKGLALAPDAYDEIKYGIKKGIYFLKTNISSFQSRLLLAHELLHHVCSKHQPELLARGLEEGLCELIGSYITNFYLFNKTIADNYIKYRRLKFKNPNQQFRLYTDYLRMAYLLLQEVGIEGVVYIINSGRKTVKDVETALIHGEKITLPTKKSYSIPCELSNGLNQLLLGTIENEVLSPLACFIIVHYKNEKTILDFSKKYNIDLIECKCAFEEIQNRVYGCVIDEGVIEFSDIEQLRKNGNIMYECAGNT